MPTLRTLGADPACLLQLTVAPGFLGCGSTAPIFASVFTWLLPLSVCVSFLSLTGMFIIGFMAHTMPGWFNLRILNLIYLQKALIAKKVTFEARIWTHPLEATTELIAGGYPSENVSWLSSFSVGPWSALQPFLKCFHITLVPWDSR